MKKHLLLFIHGLGGSSESTWSKFIGIIKSDKLIGTHFECRTYEFPTRILNFSFWSKMPKVQELAAGLKSSIENKYKDHPSIILICHSLGGIVAKKYLIDECRTESSRRVKGLVLFAVPNKGSSLANLADLISWRHSQLKQLCNDSDFLEHLEEDWIRNKLSSQIAIKCILGANDQIVTRDSATGSFPNNVIDTHPTKGHRDIVEPMDSEDDSFIFLKNFLISSLDLTDNQYLGSRDAIQNKFNSILDQLNFKPKRIVQTLLNNNPVAKRHDIAQLIEDRDCVIYRVLAISRPLDIFFAKHSLDLKSQGIFPGLQTKLFIAQEISNLQPTFTNYTIIDNHVIASIPMNTGPILKKLKHIDRKGEINLTGISSGFYISNQPIADALSRYVTSLGDNVERFSLNEGLIDYKVIDFAKENFWNGTSLEKAEYLADVTVAIKTELSATKLLKDDLLYIGMVGSVAKILLDFENNISSGENPNDLDIIFIFKKLSRSILIELKAIVAEVCEVYSFSGLDLRPQYSSSPAKPLDSGNVVPVQILIQDNASIPQNWVPYIYYDRFYAHKDILGNFPKIDNKLKFTTSQVILDPDGINYCIQTLNESSSWGYEWRVTEADITMVDSPVLLKDEMQLFSFMRYSIHWSVVNLTRAKDKKIDFNSDVFSTIQKISFKSGYAPNQHFFSFILEKKYKSSSIFSVDQCKILTIEFLEELKATVI